MARKNKFNKQIIYIIGIIIAMYLGYLILNPLLNKMEGYGPSHCNVENNITSSECDSLNCFNAKQIGKGSFCAPLGFTLAKFEGANGFKGLMQTKISDVSSVDWVITSDIQKPRCNLSLSQCGSNDNGFVCGVGSAIDNTLCDQATSYCYNAGNAGQNSFCAPIGFTKDKYYQRAVDPTNPTNAFNKATDDSVPINPTINWVTWLFGAPTCLDTLGVCGS